MVQLSVKCGYRESGHDQATIIAPRRKTNWRLSWRLAICGFRLLWNLYNKRLLATANFDAAIDISWLRQRALFIEHNE
jgi:hypothetical protein